MNGAQVTPLIHFWNRAEHPFQVELKPEELEAVVLDDAIGGSRFVASLGGVVATEETDPRLATRNLNAFLFALTLLRDHSTDPVGQNELDDCHVLIPDNRLHATRVKLSRLGSVFAWDPCVQQEMAKDRVIYLCDAGVVPIVAELADKIVQSEYEVAFYEAHLALSAKHDGEPISAFLSFWIVLEMMLATEIRRYLKRSGTSNQEIDEKLRRWGMPTKIYNLEQWTAIQPIGPEDPTIFASSDLAQVRALAPIRNQVIHTGHRPTDNEVESVAALGWRAMWRFLRLSGIVYMPYLDQANAIQKAFVAKFKLP